MLIGGLLSTAGIRGICCRAIDWAQTGTGGSRKFVSDVVGEYL